MLSYKRSAIGHGFIKYVTANTRQNACHFTFKYRVKIVCTMNPAGCLANQKDIFTNYQHGGVGYFMFMSSNLLKQHFLDMCIY